MEKIRIISAIILAIFSSITLFIIGLLIFPIGIILWIMIPVVFGAIIGWQFGVERN